MNCLYTITLCNFGFAFTHATCVIVKDFGKALLKTKSSPIFFSYKLSERKPLFEIAQWVEPATEGTSQIVCCSTLNFFVFIVCPTLRNIGKYVENIVLRLPGQSRQTNIF